MTENENLLNKLTKIIEETNEKQTKTLKTEIQTEVLQVKTEITNVKTEISMLNDIIKQEKDKVIQLEKLQSNLQKKLSSIEKEIKKNNIIIFGAEYSNDGNLAEYIINNLNSWLDLNLTCAAVNNIYPIGKPSDQNRPIVVKFLSYFTKVEVLRACKKLKGTSISIAEDLTREDRDIKRNLVKHKKIAQNKGHKVYIRKNTLFIDDQPYSEEQLEKICISDENEEKAKNSKTRRRNSAPASPTNSKNDEEKKTYRQEEGEEEEDTEIEDSDKGSATTSKQNLVEVSPLAKPISKKRRIVTTKKVGPILRTNKNAAGKQ